MIGPCYARYLAQTLHRGEDYVLQIDSHMRFRQNWDEYLINQLNKCPKLAVLTTYPPGYELPHGPGVNSETRATVLVPWKFGEDDGMLRQKSRLLRHGYQQNAGNCFSGNYHGNLTTASKENINDNIPCLLYAAGFNFFHSFLLDLCPYDHKLHGLFFGEEISMAVRLYTHGYNLFAPPQTVCYHLWARNPLRARDNCEDLKQKHVLQRGASLEVVRMQLRGVGRGLGNVRSTEEFAHKLGVDFEKHILAPGCENAGLSCDAFVSSLSADLANAFAYDLNNEVRQIDKEKVGGVNDMSLVLELVSEFMEQK